MKLKLRKSLATEQFVQNLIKQVSFSVKELYNYENKKLSPSLVQCVYATIIDEIDKSKYSRKKINVHELLKVVLQEIFDLNEQEMMTLQEIIHHIEENKLVKRHNFFLCFLNLFSSRSKKEEK